MDQTNSQTNCIFCQIVSKSLPADIVYEDNRVMAFRDINPKTETHILCIPKQHYGTLRDVAVTKAEVFGQLLQGVQKVAELLKLDGYKLVVNNGESAGQIVPHVHIHILSGHKIKDISSI